MKIGLSTRRGRRGGCGSVRAVSVVVATLAMVALAPMSARAQLINEVIAENSTQEPADILCGHPDMIEIYNDTGASLDLGDAELALSHYLARVPAEDPSPDFDVYVALGSAWAFPPNRSERPAGGLLTVFCDGNSIEGTCELHATFSLSSDGSDSVVLWGPEGDGGQRPIVDRVFLPPTSNNVSWGRSSDGAGGPNLSFEQHHEFFVRYPPGESSFGVCEFSSGICLVNNSTRRHCLGASNNMPLEFWNSRPRVTRLSQTTNAPNANVPVGFIARVRDDELPIPGNIASLEIIFRVLPSGSEIWGAEQRVEMSYLADSGVLTRPSRPLDRYTHWEGEIPAQAAGSRVEFYFRVEDEEGLSATRPRDLCHLLVDDELDLIYIDGDGPCDREFGGGDQDADDVDDNGCVRDLDDFTCRSSMALPCEVAEEHPEDYLVGERYIACNVRSTYLVGYSPRAEVAGLVINEVVATQNDVLTDFTELACDDSNRVNRPRCLDPLPGEPEDLGPDCCRRDEDFIELFNTSGSDIPVAGLWLSDSPFDVRRWQFPDGAVIPANTRVIVWLDRDGSMCPDPLRGGRPCFWECPDSNVLSMQFDPPEFHASFAIDADGDQVFIFDNEENGLGLIHGVDFGDPSSFCGFVASQDAFGNPRNDILSNQSISLIPDGDRNGSFVILSEGTPREANIDPEFICDVAAEFRRGDATDDGAVDISDGVSILGFLFTGGPAPVCPDAADSDDNAAVDLSDAVWIFQYLFLGGPPPEAPGPSVCGPDPTEDGLGDCESERCDP